MDTGVEAKHATARILLAEDSRTQATQLEYVLQSRGYEVACVQNGREALASLHERLAPQLYHKGYLVCGQLCQGQGG